MCMGHGYCIIRYAAYHANLNPAQRALAVALHEDDQLRQPQVSAAQEYARDNYMLPDDTNPYEKRHTEPPEARPKRAGKY